MPRPIETDERNQKALVFTLIGRSDDGEPIHDDPVEIDVRWENILRTVKLSDTETVTISALVVVDREITQNSLMWLGELTDWYGSGSDDQGGNMMQVYSYNAVPDLKGRHTRRTVELCRFRDG